MKATLEQAIVSIVFFSLISTITGGKMSVMITDQ